MADLHTLIAGLQKQGVAQQHRRPRFLAALHLRTQSSTQVAIE